MKSKITIADLIDSKEQGRKISAVSCYDYSTAKVLSETEIEMILVGDSAGQVVLGFNSTLPVTMDFMVAITAGVRRGAPNVFLVADMPFLSYQVGLNEAIKNAGRFFAEAGAQMVKIEATEAYLDVIKAVSDAGMSVMAHIGIRPQSIAKKGKLRAEGTDAVMAAELVSLAQQMINAGASALLLEGTACEVSKIITRRSEVPVIGCGAGPNCDGQILISPDILGFGRGARPKFAKSYGQLADAAAEAFATYDKEIKAGQYPDDGYSYHMKKGEFEKLEKLLG